MSRLKIEQHWFGNEEYVLINIAVGATKRPNRLIMKGCLEFKEKSRLCRMLTQKGIKFDIMPVLVDQFDSAPMLQDDSSEMFEELRAEIEDAKDEAMRYTEEVRDEVRAAGVDIPGGPQPCDFGLDIEPQIEIKMDVPEIPEWTLTKSEGPEAWVTRAYDEKEILVSPFNHSPFDEPKTSRVDEDDEKEALNDVLDHFRK